MNFLFKDKRIVNVLAAFAFVFSVLLISAPVAEAIRVEGSNTIIEEKDDPAYFGRLIYYANVSGKPFQMSGSSGSRVISINSDAYDEVESFVDVVLNRTGAIIGTTALNPVLGFQTIASDISNASRSVGATGSIHATNDGACVKWSANLFPYFDVPNCIAQALYIALWALSYVVSFVGGIFDFVFNKTVRNLKETIESITIIKTGWTVVRDLCNIFFIFMLLWLAISTILQLDEHGVKHGLSRLIMAAILINFSLLFTKMVIDVPNMISVVLYDQVTGGTASRVGSPDGGLGSAAFNILNPEKVGRAIGQEADTRSTSGVVLENAQQFAATGSPITTFFMMIILYAIILFVFLAVVIIFIKRFIIMLFLMIFSPLAFLGMAVPIHSLQHEAQSKFWNTLFKESFYAPIFILCFYITIQTGVVFQEQGGGNIVPTIFAFSVIIIMMVASLIIAEHMGVSGAGGTMSTFKSMAGGSAGWIGRNTIGAGAYNLIEKTKLGTEGIKQMRQGVLFGRKIPTWLGGGIVRGVGYGLTEGLGKLGEGHHHDIEKDMETFGDSMNELRDDPRKQAKFFAQMMKGSSALGGLKYPYYQKMAKYVGVKMKDEEVASLVKFMEGDGYHAEAESLMDYLGKQRKTNVKEIMSNKITAADKVQMGSMLQGLETSKEFNRTGGSISVDDGHGHLKTLSGAEAIKHMADNKIDRNIDVMLDRINQTFSNFSEKQKNEILGTLSQAEQKLIADNLSDPTTGPKLMHTFEKHFNNYRKLEQTMKGGMNEDLMKKLSSIAYRGSDRTSLSNLIYRFDHNVDGFNSDADAQANIVEWRSKLAELNAGFSQAEQEELLRENITYLKADKNFTRLAGMSQEHVDILKTLAGKKVQEIIKDLKSS